MLSSIWVSSALCAVALAAPAIPGALTTTQTEVLSGFFELVATKVQEAKKAPAPACNLNNAVMPAASPTPLPPVSAGLKLKHVAIGRGTQNYTCGSDPAAAPVANGAVATLYDASCLAATSPTVLAAIPKVVLQFNLTSVNQRVLAPANLIISGTHYFTNPTTPLFNLGALGTVTCKKDSAVPAPAGSPLGQNGVGSGTVPWLKLVAREGATGGLQEVYRINTAGGSAPATCAGQPSAFQVEYSTEYWFYAS